MDFVYLLTSFEGRINRKPYWLGSLLLFAIALVIILTFTFVIVGVTALTTGMGFGARLVLFVIQMAFMYPFSALAVKRLHDRGRPTYFVLFMIVPVVLSAVSDLAGLTGNPLASNMLDYLFALVIFVIGIWFLVELGFLRGTVGPNQHGPDPLQGRP